MMLDLEELENQADRIGSEGLDYYLQHYGANTTDVELQKLYDAAAKALNDVTQYFESNGIDLSDY